MCCELSTPGSAAEFITGYCQEDCRSRLFISAEGGNETGAGGSSGQTGTIIDRRVKAEKPKMYKVLLHNDDYTPMEFVIEVLEKFFHKTHAEATEIMLTVHHEGQGICGVFPFEVAETKVALVSESAREHEHPLQCSMEKD